MPNGTQVELGLLLLKLILLMFSLFAFISCDIYEVFGFYFDNELSKFKSQNYHQNHKFKSSSNEVEIITIGLRIILILLLTINMTI